MARVAGWGEEAGLEEMAAAGSHPLLRILRNPFHHMSLQNTMQSTS